MQNKLILTGVLALALVAGMAQAEQGPKQRSYGGTVTTNGGKTYAVQGQVTTDGQGNYQKDLTVNDKPVRDVTGGGGTRTVTLGDDVHSRTVTRSGRRH